MLIFSRVSLLCAALLAVLGTARAEEITRVFELRHADAGQVAAVLGGQPPDRVGVGDRWASNVINEALAWAAPRAEHRVILLGAASPTYFLLHVWKALGRG